MKKILGMLALLILTFAAAVSADQWAGAATDETVYDYGGLVAEVSGSNAYCTLTTSNAKTILSNTKIEPGWKYILVHDTITGSSAATAVVEVVIQSLDDNNMVLYSKIVDSIAGATEQYGGLHELPYFSEAVGHKFKLILQGDTGAENIFNRIYIYKVRPIAITRWWK